MKQSAGQTAFLYFNFVDKLMIRPKRSLYITTLAASFMMVTVVGCGTAHDSNAGSPDVTVDITQVQRAQKMNKEQQIASAQKHLAGKLQIEESEITLTSAQAVTWRSGAMGCPKPDMMYTMALVPGILIVLNVTGRSYRYHASTNGEPAYCPAERVESAGGGPTDM